MQDTKEEIRDRFFHELALRLGKEGIETENRERSGFIICPAYRSFFACAVPRLERVAKIRAGGR